MQESKRQKQVAKVIQQEMNAIFQYLSMQTVGKNGMVSISKVVVTPDLLEARVYLSLFQIADTQLYLQDINERVPEFRGMLGNRVKNQLRRIPTLAFYIDDTLDYVFKMEEIFTNIAKEREQNNNTKV